MSPTLLELTIGVIAAALVFLFALRAVPLAVELLSRYFDRTLDQVEYDDEKEPQDYER